MHFLRTLLVRNDSASASASTSAPLSPLTAKLLVALLVLAILGIALLGILVLLRARRRRKQARRSTLPTHSPRQVSCRSHRRLTITAAPYGRHSKVFVMDEKRSLYAEAEAESPGSPVPEIRITFPDEPDADGKSQSGRVVVVQLNENGSVGLGPCAHDDDLPPYQSGDRFQSLDLDRMGGLKEKELEKWF